MSLDGFVTDKDGGLDFFTQLTPEQNTYPDKEQLKFPDSVDTILPGRKTYELFVDFWPSATTNEEVIADKLNEIDKIVFTNTLYNAPWGKWKPATIIRDDVVLAVKEMKALPGKNMVLWGSISLAQALMKENLIDEYHIQLCPVVNGGGRKLFPEGFVNTLDLFEVRHYNSGTAFLNYHKKKK